MTLEDMLKTAIIEDLKKLSILWLNEYAIENNRILTFSYRNNIIDDFSIEGALEISILKQARKDYKIITKKIKLHTIYADHAGSPECLAYALIKNEFSKREIERIPFDSEENDEVFSKYYGKENLPSILRKELLNPTPAKISWGYCDPHPVCEI